MGTRSIRPARGKGAFDVSSLGLARKAAYVGAGAGLTVFALIGLLPGSFLGGSIGLGIAKALLGSPVSSALLPRVIVGLSMLLGVIISGIVFVVCGTMVGWVMGNMMGAIPVRAYFTGRGQAKKDDGK